MALVIYVPTQWVNGTAPAINSAKLNHIENGIKAVTDAVLANEVIIANLMPINSIIMFSGTVIPDGWALCDGTQGTPNLINKFIRGGNTGAIGATGGSDDAIVVAHTHTGTTSSDGAHTHLYNEVANNDSYAGGTLSSGAYTSGNTGSAGAHTHSVSVNSSGVSGAGKNLPSYYTLAYIMKIA